MLRTEPYVSPNLRLADVPGFVLLDLSVQRTLVSEKA